MAEKTAIAWTRSTFNPWKICTPIGPGCLNCYAAALSRRYGWGEYAQGVPRQRTSEANWREPLKWEKKAAAGDKPWRVFCASLADVFDNEVDRMWRYDLWRLIEATPNLSWLLVTKRVGNVIGMVPVNWEQRFPDNVRLLITVCNQQEADRDIPKLLALPCKNGVSYEPALGPIDFTTLPSASGIGRYLDALSNAGVDPGALVPNRIEWIIVGGESTQGSGKARPFDLAWARSTVAQCKAAGVPVFVKQLGSNAQEIAHPTGVSGKEMLRWQRDGWTQIHEGDATHWRKYYRLKDRAGADSAEWPEDLRVQEFPE